MSNEKSNLYLLKLWAVANANKMVDSMVSNNKIFTTYLLKTQEAWT